MARARVAPGEVAEQWRIGEEGDWWFAFRLIDRGAGWRLVWGAPVEEKLARYLAGGGQPFANLKSDLAATAARGSSFTLSFDFQPPPELGEVEEVELLFFPEPQTPGYPQGYETGYSTYWFGPDGKKMRVEHFELSEKPGPDGVVRGPVGVPEALPPGAYRVYLGLGTRPNLYWPFPPYVVRVE
ncbi:MAG: hypothetical protein ACPLPT_03025 [Moorellales bacterium]